MGIILQVLYDVLLKYFFIPMVIIYIIGTPKFLILFVNKLLLIKDPIYGIRILFSLVAFFISSMIFNIYRKFNLQKILDADMQSGMDKNNHLIELHERNIFLYERNIYIYCCFFVMIIVFLKFSAMYDKTYELEKNLQELKNDNNNLHHD